MKTKADVLRTLAGLRPDDRRWIAERLSKTAREALCANEEASEQAVLTDARLTNGSLKTGQGVSLSASLPNQSKKSNVAADEIVNELMAADGRILAALLADEPTWVVHATLSARRWPWEGDVLNGLSPERRKAIAELTARGAHYGPRLVNALLEKCVESTRAYHPVEARSSFSDLVDKLGALRSLRRTRSLS